MNEPTIEPLVPATQTEIRLGQWTDYIYCEALVEFYEFYRNCRREARRMRDGHHVCLPHSTSHEIRLRIEDPS